MDPRITIAQISWGGGTGGAPSIMSALAAEEIVAYSERIARRLASPDHESGPEDFALLRASLPIAGGIISASCAGRGDGVVKAEDVAKGITFLETTGTRLCDQG